jgi:putative membrane-bound dehydrogenase-like protein
LTLAAIWGRSLSGDAQETGQAPAGPVAPRESLEQFVVSPGLRVELAACEPQVIDPVAMRFDEHGRMWVVEMRDYPVGTADGNPNSSRISILSDADGDGYFETARVFADGLKFATGVQPWRGGAFVTMGGEVAFMKDSDGDGRADVVETWFTGFAEDNTQLRANHPRLALDNYIYVANGLRGGQIVDARRPGAEPVSISGRDFRFDPRTGASEAVSGVGQFGMTFDDYGNRFVCSNRNPAMHIVLAHRDLEKNPRVAVAAVTQDVAAPAEQSRVYPLARSWTTSNLHAGQFTAACGVEVFRGDGLPADCNGNVFICEPTGHLVHREQVHAEGASFRSTPAEEPGKEFLASRDAWFSPVNLELGPDGALYVVDMYRAVIEHPQWAPEELQKRPDQLDGNDRGRIYRVVTAGRERARPPVDLPGDASHEQLTARLRNANAWQRETAARLLLESETKSPGIAAKLSAMARDDDSPLARIHALRVLEGLSLVDDVLLAAVLEDRDPRVLEQALRVAEPRLNAPGALRQKAAALRGHEDARVRVAAILALAPEVTSPAHPTDAWERDAVLIAAGARGGDLLAALLADPDRLKSSVGAAGEFICQAARLAAASDDQAQRAAGLRALVASDEFRQAGLASFLRERIAGGEALETVRGVLDASEKEAFDRALVRARETAKDASQPDDARTEALELAAMAKDATELIAQLAAHDPSQPVRLRAIAALARMAAVEPWHALLAGYADDTPAVQRAVLDGLLAHSQRTHLLLDAIAAGQLKANELDAARKAALLNHRDPAIKARAEQLLADAIPADRQEALADYQAALGLPANPLHGREVFSKQCATCHRIGEIGVDVAPDISDSRVRTGAQYLTDILQPNRAVDSNYFSYTAITADGLAITGILAAETATSITLKEAEGREKTLRRDEIEQLAANGVSLMPEGLEREIPHQDMADLISFIKNWRYLDGQTPAGGQ